MLAESPCCRQQADPRILCLAFQQQGPTTVLRRLTRHRLSHLVHGISHKPVSCRCITGAAVSHVHVHGGAAHCELAAGRGIGDLEGDGSCGCVIWRRLDEECALDCVLHSSSLHITHAVGALQAAYVLQLRSRGMTGRASANRQQLFACQQSHTWGRDLVAKSCLWWDL